MTPPHRTVVEVLGKKTPISAVFTCRLSCGHIVESLFRKRGQDAEPSPPVSVACWKCANPTIPEPEQC